jgi:hypothetical protein
MENDWEYLHGGVDPGQDENLNLVESVAVTGREEADLEHRNNLSSSKENGESSKAPQCLVGMPLTHPGFLKPLPCPFLLGYSFQLKRHC